jgi:hypothetical protein
VEKKLFSKEKNHVFSKKKNLRKINLGKTCDFGGGRKKKGKCLFFKNLEKKNLEKLKIHWLHFFG